MQHTESTSKIYFTNDYSQFQFVQGNRDIVEAKIKRLTKTIQNGLDLTKQCPIVVDSSMNIIDGQHRFYTCKSLGKPIYYVIKENLTIRDIAKLNSNSDKWTTRDFINCYVDLQVKDYKILLEFIEMGYPPSTAASLLNQETFKESASKILFMVREGEFQATQEEVAREFHEYLQQFKPYVIKPTDRPYMVAMYQLRNNPEFSADLLIKKLRSSQRIIEQQANVKQYMQVLEDIYNFRNSKIIRLY